MKRRQFIKQGSLLAIGGLLLPSSLISSCRKTTLGEKNDFKGKVLIIGAGASGLYAGYLLQSKGISFQILEARAVHGGRMGKLSGFADYDIDTGAQWLHGRNNILGDLVKKHQIPNTLDNSEITYWFKQQLLRELPKDPAIFEKDNLPDVSFKDYATQQGFGPEYDQIIEAFAGDQGADASLLSAYWNNKEEENWVSGNDDFKFNKTFYDVIHEHIAQPVLGNILYNTPVTSIRYDADKIHITDASQQVHEADKVIITVPISILKSNDITFTPPLPTAQTEAFQKLGMGPGMKVFLKFSSKFYDQNIIGGSICAAYADDTVGKTTQDHVLLAFIMGDQAAYLHSLASDTAITNALLQELDSMYGGKASQSFISSTVHDYTNKPYIKGAYSFSTIGMGNAREIAATSVENKLFFAGEAMNKNGHHQTVHGAIEAGYQAVMDILNT